MGHEFSTLQFFPFSPAKVRSFLRLPLLCLFAKCLASDKYIEMKGSNKNLGIKYK